MTISQRGEPQHYKTVFETRTFFSFRVREAALQAVLPQGWIVAESTDGHDRGSNVRFGLSDQLAAVDSDGAPMATARFCPLTVSARNSASSSADVNRIAIGYWSSASYVEPFRLSALPGKGEPGPTRTPDLVETAREVRADSTGAAVGRQQWLFKSASQEVTAEVSWTSVGQTHEMEQFWVLVPSLGESFRRYQIEKVEETVLSKPLGIDRLRSVSFRAAGPTLAPLFDGSEELVSIVIQPFGRREIYLY